MHDTTNPATGEPQQMVWPSDSTAVDAEGKSLAGQAKGMEQVLQEHQLLGTLDTKNGRYVGVCADCKKSQAARDKAAKEAKAREDEIEGSGVEGFGERGVSETEVEDLTRSRTCCMQRVLSLQPDFVAEKPLLQVIIEKAGHKCLFLPKFHCELNPIEMVWGQAKRCKCRLKYILLGCLTMFCLDFRERADGTFPKAQKLVVEALDRITAPNVRWYFRHCFRYMDAYKCVVFPFFLGSYSHFIKNWVKYSSSGICSEEIPIPPTYSRFYNEGCRGN
jgi:hypothetical protein